MFRCKPDVIQLVLDTFRTSLLWKDIKFLLYPLVSFQVLKLLIMAWDRRLIFTIGTSSTTGESDTVVWNEIHHKTEFGSNLTGHGYPDPNYLDNVLTELSAQGVGEDNLKD